MTDIDIYKVYTFKDYIYSNFSEWRYPDIKSRDMTQVSRYILPNIGELTPTTRGFNAFTTLCDSFLNTAGDVILKWTGYATYMYQGGVLQPMYNDHVYETYDKDIRYTVAFRIPGYTCGELVIDGNIITDVHLNEIMYTEPLALYEKEITKVINVCIGSKYTIDRLEGFIPWKP